MHLLVLLLSVPFTLAGPLAGPISPALHERQQDPLAGLNGILNIVNEGVLPLTGNLLSALASEFKRLQPTATPTSIPDAVSQVSSIFASQPTTLTQLIDASGKLVVNGLSPRSIEDLVNTYNTAENNGTNMNTHVPPHRIYPRANSTDPKYSIAEASLRDRIYIPKSFTYGAKPPVILVPGTGTQGGSAFAGNVRKMLANKPYADVVWINGADFALQDVQLTAEVVAYAVHYISAVSKGRKVAVISWSQGSIDTQWALKYWPSTRHLVSDHIPISPDYHGTTVAPILCSPLFACPPSLLQQEYESKFIATLRADGGDSAYVPVTTIYSGLFDEIVEPQQGTGASGFLRDARRVGVTNNEVGAVCKGKPAGAFVTHESMLYNPLTAALIADALQHDGPGRVGRLNLNKVCSGLAADGLTIDDVVSTESTIPVALYQILVYPNRGFTEPRIAAYAR